MMYLSLRSNLTACFWAVLLLQLATGQLEAQDQGTFDDPRAEYEWRIKQERLLGKYIPKDIEDALKELERLVDGGATDKVKALKEDEFVKRLFFGFGKWMTVNWSFYEGSRLSHHLRETGITHPDDMTTAMMLFYHRRVLGLPLEIKSTAEELKKKREELRKDSWHPTFFDQH